MPVSGPVVGVCGAGDKERQAKVCVVRGLGEGRARILTRRRRGDRRKTCKPGRGKGGDSARPKTAASARALR